MDLSQTSVFYQSVLTAWKTVFKVQRDCSHVGEEPLFFNPLISSRMLSTVSVQRFLINAGLTKLVGLRTAGQWKRTAKRAQESGVRSLCLLEKLVEQVMASLPGLIRAALGTHSAGDKPTNVP